LQLIAAKEVSPERVARENSAKKDEVDKIIQALAAESAEESSNLN
jgi:hypothetical protein